MTTSPVMGRPGVKLHEGKASGLVVKVWDAQARSLLSFSLNERIRARTTVKDLKKKIRKEREYPVEVQRLFHNNQELKDQAVLSDIVSQFSSHPD
jgi:hypothetical protein